MLMFQMSIKFLDRLVAIDSIKSNRIVIKISFKAKQGTIDWQENQRLCKRIDRILLYSFCWYSWLKPKLIFIKTKSIQLRRRLGGIHWKQGYLILKRLFAMKPPNLPVSRNLWFHWNKFLFQFLKPQQS